MLCGVLPFANICVYLSKKKSSGNPQSQTSAAENSNPPQNLQQSPNSLVLQSSGNPQSQTSDSKNSNHSPVSKNIFVLHQEILETPTNKEMTKEGGDIHAQKQLLTYSWRKNFKKGDILRIPYGQESNSKSGHETNVSDLDIPMAIRKGTRSCTSHPISNFAAYFNTYLPQFRHFVLIFQMKIFQRTWKRP